MKHEESTPLNGEWNRAGAPRDGRGVSLTTHRGMRPTFPRNHSHREWAGFAGAHSRRPSDEQRKWGSKRSRHGAHEAGTVHLIQARFTCWGQVLGNWDYCIAGESSLDKSVPPTTQHPQIPKPPRRGRSRRCRGRQDPRRCCCCGALRQSLAATAANVAHARRLKAKAA
jgi:hypothetical protein